MFKPRNTLTMNIYRIHRPLAALLAATLVLGSLTEGRHGCEADPAPAAAEAHGGHRADHSVPASDHGHDTCDCMGRCCSSAPLAWGPVAALSTIPHSVEAKGQLRLSSQHTPLHLRGRLPLSQAPPSHS